MWSDERLDSGKRCTGCGAWVGGRPEAQLTCRTLRGPMSEQPAADSRADCSERTYSFGAYLRSRVGFVLAMAALMAVVAGILAVTGSNASAIALVSICEALFAYIVLAVGFLRYCKFYQQLDLFCNSPENARYLSSILDEPRTLEGSIAYRALAVQGKAASDELAARSRHEGISRLHRTVGPRG